MDALEAVGDPELRATLLVVRGEERPVTADEVAAARGLHRNVARSQLERLARAELLETSFERRSGRSGPGAGRPAKTYAVAPELAQIEFPSRHFETLLGHLVDVLPARGRRRRLQEAGAAFGRELASRARLRPARRPEQGLERVCEAMRRLGFQASLDSADDDHAVILSPTCPLRPLVAARLEATAVDHGMWAGLVESALADVDAADVVCETSGCLDSHAACRIAIRLRQRD